MEQANFSGAKLAIIAAGQILTMLRDNRADIPYPGLWDLPGGGREAGESPLECALRETLEETGLRLPPGVVTWERVYPNERPGLLPTWFMAAEPGWLALPPLRLGDEGQELRWMPLEMYLGLGDAIPHMQERVREYLAGKDIQAWRSSRFGS